MRLRDLGIVPGIHPPGPLNAITDVPDVRVGHTTLVRGEGRLVVGEGPVRTGVTAILPHGGSIYRSRCPAAIGVLNGAGEITGRSQVDEYGVLETPIVLTNTLSVGVAHRATVDWLVANDGLADDFVIPVVAETYDGFLNDIRGQHVTGADVLAALDGATDGPVAEGNVGGGTGMALFQLKGGIGTSSRVLTIDGTPYTIGVLVQGNYGRRHHLRIDGRPLGIEHPELAPERPAVVEGSIIVVIATDIPLSDRQLGRLCRRGMLGIGRTGGIGGHSSGDLLIAFSNAPSARVPRPAPDFRDLGVPPFLSTPRLHDAFIDPVFEATAEATEEAIFNAMVAAETMVGRDGHVLHALPHHWLR
ncbi:MAG: P1 family peptidase [Alphaproteobacteria bacterium]|nr:P1 family peptidase [Alphaproteobacteria bacterium]